MPTPPFNNKKGLFTEQFIPLSLTLVVLAFLILLFYFSITILNKFPTFGKISLQLRWADVLIGATIYLKTAVDFAIFMGRLMSSNPGWKKRVAIEVGTALGNGLGTILILVVWTFFKEVEWLLGLMILLASLVLFELAFAGLEHFEQWQAEGGIKKGLFLGMDKFLSVILKIIRPLISKIIPDLGKKLKGDTALPWNKLIWLAFTIPFVLGLDDFAGYVPLFNVVNVFGFSVGVMAAHTALNIALFLNPQKTVAAVRNSWISFLGSLAFVGLAVWGLIEAVKIFSR